MASAVAPNCIRRTKLIPSLCLSHRQGDLTGWIGHELSTSSIKKLLDEGAITEDEYKAFKEKLLKE